MLRYRIFKITNKTKYNAFPQSAVYFTVAKIILVRNTHTDFRLTDDNKNQHICIYIYLFYSNKNNLKIQETIINTITQGKIVQEFHTYINHVNRNGLKKSSPTHSN